MTVGELKRLLHGVDDNFEISVEGYNMIGQLECTVIFDESDEETSGLVGTDTEAGSFILKGDVWYPDDDEGGGLAN